MADKLKLFASFLFVAAGIAAFYFIPQDYPPVLRLLAVLVGAGLAFAVFSTSALGRVFVQFCKDSVTEAQKVVWPSRKETVQTTLIVFVFVFAVAIFLWMTDKTLEWLLYDLLLGWK